MVSVLITRPLAASQNLAEELLRHGYDSIIESLLVIEPLTVAPPNLSEIQAIMITSQNALETGQGLECFFHIPCFCVGTRTAEKARALGFQKVQSSNSDGAELAQLIGSVLKADGGSILHIAGRHVHSLARERLKAHGYPVVEWTVYVAHSALGLTEKTLGLLREHRLGAVLIFSARTAETLVALFKQYRLEACCQGLTAIGLSDAVTAILKSLPWKNLVTASAPTEDAVIDKLKQFHPVF